MSEKTESSLVVVPKVDADIPATKIELFNAIALVKEERDAYFLKTVEYERDFKEGLALATKMMNTIGFDQKMMSGASQMSAAKQFRLATKITTALLQLMRHPEKIKDDAEALNLLLKKYGITQQIEQPALTNGNN